MKDLYDKNLMALIPSYKKDTGNITVIYRHREDNLILNKTIKSTINSIGRYYALDLKRLKDRYSHIVEGHNLMPIPMDPNNILIPVKTRKPKYKNDGAFSYINIRHIKSIEKNINFSKIILKDNRTIHTVFSYESTMKHYRNGLVIKNNLNSIVKESDEIYDLNLEEINELKKLLDFISYIKK